MTTKSRNIPSALARAAGAPRTTSPTFATALSGRSPNSFTFVRWVLAVLVVVDHSYPLSGLLGGNDPMWAWSRGQDSMGGLAVSGFFLISGFLVCRSWSGSATTRQFIWKRFLRIFPGFWVCLGVTAFVLAPLAWIHERGPLTSRFFNPVDGPLQYIRANALLNMHQWGIDGLLSRTPYRNTGFPIAWDGSLWTLIYEFKCYLLLALLGYLGLLANRRLVALLTGGFYLVMLSTVVDPGATAKLMPVLQNLYIARFGFLFLFGATLALYADRLLVDDRLGIAATALALLTLRYGGWEFLGYAALGYALLWLAARLPMHRWERIGDLSYGTYIYSFPVQMMLAEHGLQRHGFLAFVLGSLAGTTILALLSWHLVENRALALKNRTSVLLGTRRRTALPAPTADEQADPPVAQADGLAGELASRP